MIDEFGKARPERILVVTSLGQIRYLSAMQHCDVVIGNSSSGIVEAPALKKVTVNIGSRQDGPASQFDHRLRGERGGNRECD